jgi:pimeloyl-ACP methyl ester carboxylesterase
VPAAHALDFCARAGRQCVRVVVPIDRSGAVPGTIALQVERQRAAHPATRPPLFLIAGGPGESATRVFDPLVVRALLGKQLGGRDVIVVDVRGTGDSAALRCPALQRADLLHPDAAVRACAASLGARSAFYTTRDNVADIESVRVALGAPQIALYGGSYGTEVALDYAHAHPDHIERVVLDSVVPPQGVDPLNRSSFVAAPRVMRAFCASVSCAPVTRDAGRDLAALARRLSRGSLRGRVFDRFGRGHRATFRGIDLLDIVDAGDLDPAARAAVPGAVRSALRGDAAPILRVAREDSEAGEPTDPQTFSAGTLAATLCEESALPWDRSSPPATRRAQARQTLLGLAADAFGPFGQLAALDSPILELCTQWPAAAAAPDLGAPGNLTAPVLLMSGDADGRTPIEDARRVASSLPNAQLLVEHGAGHGVLYNYGTRCLIGAFRRFLAGKAAGTCSPLHLGFFVHVRPFPRALRDVPRANGIPGRAGRTLTAVRLTLRDGTPSFDAVLGTILSDEVLRLGGLRGGASATSGGGAKLALHHYSFIDGVRVSGTLRDFDDEDEVRGTLRVSGRAGVHGTLTVHGQRVRGRLAGRSVDVRMELNLFTLTD